MSKQVLSVLVENRAGVLSRISGLFSRRGFNIDSLAVGTAEDENTSRMTIVVNGDEQEVEQVAKQLGKLIDVIKIRRLDSEESVLRELALIKVKSDSASRAEITQVIDIFRAKIVDVALDTMTIEMTGTKDKHEALLELLAPFGICEIVRTGTIALERRK